MVPRGLARFIRQPFNNMWESAKHQEVCEGVLRLAAEKPEVFMNSHEKTTLGVLLKGSNQGAMALYIDNVMLCAFEGNLNVFQNWSDVFFNYVDNNFDLSAANGKEFNQVILMLGGISFPEFWACVGFFHESHKKYKYFEHVEHLLNLWAAVSFRPTRRRTAAKVFSTRACWWPRNQSGWSQRNWSTPRCETRGRSVPTLSTRNLASRAFWR
mmetsp:Transcript_20033/g.51468  ORF Transcript_20033/g.51468 Transcript_20033/m.51468 type:complete len:212 (+) Transcript_20033:840-1475(+)